MQIISTIKISKMRVITSYLNADLDKVEEFLKDKISANRWRKEPNLDT